MSAVPLTHHEMLALVEPFARQGRQVDLAASDRVARRIVFKPLARGSDGCSDGGSDGDAARGAQELLTLDCREGGHHRLTRTLTRPGGLAATLQTAGADLVALLARVDAVAPAAQFVDGPGWAVARSYEFGAAAGAGSAPTLILVRGDVQVEGLHLTLHVLDVRGTAGDLVLAAPPGESLELPEDLLAVLGWSWARLVPTAEAWTSKVRLRGKGAPRSRRAEQVLETAAAHLARVMAEPPAAFHRRHLGARWGVVLRRSIPTLTALGLIAGALLLPRMVGEQNSGLMMALHYVPIAVLALSFSLQELARFEIPPLPRRLKAAQWRRPAPPAAPEPGAWGTGLRSG